MKELNGMDCAAKLNHRLALSLKSNGIQYVARYLGNSWKSMDKTEVDAIIGAGLQIVSIWETNPTYAAYFSKAQGISDAMEASSYANAIEQTGGSAIYFAVDYDAQPSDMAAILNYFSGVRDGIDKSYKVGVYGSYSVLKTLYRHHAVNFYWQTTSWSRGNVADFNDILQFQHNTTLAGIQVDYNEISDRAGSWSHILQLSEPVFYMINSGDTLSKIALVFKTTVAQLQAWNDIRNPNIIMAGQRIRVK